MQLGFRFIDRGSLFACKRILPECRQCIGGVIRQREHPTLGHKNIGRLLAGEPGQERLRVGHRLPPANRLRLCRRQFGTCDRRVGAGAQLGSD
jgi:hypothetical protein